MHLCARKQYHLRLLLITVLSPTSFDDLRTIDKMYDGACLVKGYCNRLVWPGSSHGLYNSVNTGLCDGTCDRRYCQNYVGVVREAGSDCFTWQRLCWFNGSHVFWR